LRRGRPALLPAGHLPARQHLQRGRPLPVAPGGLNTGGAAPYKPRP
jgi:hypothetical protein